MQAGRSPSLLQHLASAVRKVEPSPRVPCERYLTTAGKLVQQADGYREQHNDEQLYVSLMRLASLLLETIPKHPNFAPGEPQYQKFKKDLVSTYLPELETLKDVLAKKDEDRRLAAMAQSNTPEPVTSQTQSAPSPRVLVQATTETQSPGSPLGASPVPHEVADASQTTSSGQDGGGSLPQPVALASYASMPSAVSSDNQTAGPVMQPAFSSVPSPVGTDTQTAIPMAPPANAMPSPGDTDAQATQSVTQSAHVSEPSQVSSDTNVPQSAAAMAYPEIMSPSPMVTDEGSQQPDGGPEPVAQSQATKDLRPVYLPSDTLQQFVAYTTESSKGGTVCSLGLLAGKTGPDNASLLATKLLIPSQLQSATGVAAKEEGEILTFLPEGTFVIALILGLPSGSPLTMSRDTEATCRAHQAVLPECCAVLVQNDASDGGSREYRVLQVAGGPLDGAAEGSRCSDCRHVHFLPQLAVEVVDLRGRDGGAEVA